jgi:SAM-dependent methyltransferase
MKKAEGESAEVRTFVERVFRLMEMSRFRAADITPNQAMILGTLLPIAFPSTWGGSVPAFTAEHRHKRIDAYLRSNPWATPGEGAVLLDIGCGFPPQTAIDAAHAFPQWQVIGADPCFDEYLVYDADSSYACLNHDGQIRFFGVKSFNLAAVYALYRDREAAKRRFSNLFTKLKAALPPVSDGQPASVEHDGAKIVRDPVGLDETSNLKMIQAGIGSELPAADIIRCFNVLLYFDKAFRAETEEWALRTLRPGGLFICGTNEPTTWAARYSVYRSEGGHLAAKEFAFSIDNVRPMSVNPWIAHHDGDHETWTLAKLSGILRADEDFRASYDSRVDALLEEKRLYFRQPDGYLGAVPDQIPQSEFFEATREINARLEQEDFASRAAVVLRDAGWEAWVNPVGHVAVRPPLM